MTICTSGAALLLAVAAAFAAQVKWNAGALIMAPGSPGSFDETAVKDPSIVFSEGRWHLFYTARGGRKYSIGYTSAPTLEGLASAPRRQIPQLRGNKDDYAAAPQVFYFRPHRKWYLIYQTTDSNYQPVYSTTTKLDDPASWTPPTKLLDKDERAKWIDFWIICDNTRAHLFFTRAHKEVVVMSAPIAEFPSGFRDPVPVVSPLIEAAHVYRVAGPQNRYIMLYEWGSQDVRRFALAEATNLRGPWSIRNVDFATGENLVYSGTAPVWTNEISHGELLRKGVDERLEVERAPFRFLIQGMPSALHKGEYVNLPWRLGLISSEP